MKPIIIMVENGKINMTFDEFKKHMDDSYQQGYRDASPITFTNSNDNRWGTIPTVTLSKVTSTVSPTSI